MLLEDSAALVGLEVAFFGIFLGRQLGLTHLDGVASIIIGLLLRAVAVLMVYESKGLLVGVVSQFEILGQCLCGSYFQIGPLPKNAKRRDTRSPK